MSKSQRNKGANAEREVVHILQAHGYTARRGQCFDREPDVVCRDGAFEHIHIEVKRQETTQLPAWFAQSQDACRGDEVPCVVHRRSREAWKITMGFEDFLRILDGSGVDG